MISRMVFRQSFDASGSIASWTTIPMKSHKFAGACFAGIFLLISGTMASCPNVVDAKTARTSNCRNPNEYRFVVVENPNRKNDSDPVIPQDLNIVVGDEVISKIELPKESQAKNFSLNSTEKDRVGFKIKVDWGSGLHHYEIQFNFRCKENNFYLYRVTKVSLSTTNPDSGNFLDRKKSKVTQIKPNLPIEKFVMTDYL